MRIAPGLSPGGEHWRCSITPVTNISVKHGARLVEWEHLAAHYTSGAGAKYFDWSYAANLDPLKLAKRFIEEFPLIAEAGRGSDWGYAGWYQEMLGLTYPDLLPVAYRDEGCPNDRLLTAGGKTGGGVVIPLPPPGECVGSWSRREGCWVGSAARQMWGRPELATATLFVDLGNGVADVPHPERGSTP